MQIKFLFFKIVFVVLQLKFVDKFDYTEIKNFFMAKKKNHQ